jgi:hypothetical protein
MVGEDDVAVPDPMPPVLYRTSYSLRFSDFTTPIHSHVTNSSSPIPAQPPTANPATNGNEADERRQRQPEANHSLCVLDYRYGLDRIRGEVRFDFPRPPIRFNKATQCAERTEGRKHPRQGRQ